MYSAVLFTSQALKVARNIKKAYFAHFINVNPNKALFRHNNPKSEPNAEI